MNTIERQVRALIAQRLGVAETQLTRDTSLRDLGADSLASMQMFVALEDAFDIDIPDEDAAQMKSVREIVDYIVLAPGKVERRVH